MDVIDRDNLKKKRWNDTEHSPLHYLMTHERTQLLDILKHLIANSDQPIIVCGPAGIGKRTLLNILQRDNFIAFRNLPPAIFTGAEPDGISKLIDKAAKPEMRKKQRQAFKPEDQESDKPQNICLIIDDAGSLPPGIMTSILQWLNENDSVRLICVMTHDQLYLKNRSDPVIEDCHVVEVPPFTEEQTGEFLLHLASKSSAAVPKTAITEALIADIYRQTEGKPAGIIAKLPDLIETKTEKDSAWLLFFAVCSLVAVALYVQFFSSGQPLLKIKEINKPVRFVQKSFATERKLMTQLMPALASAYNFQNTFPQPGLDLLLQQGQGSDALTASSDTGNKSLPQTASKINRPGEPVSTAETHLASNSALPPPAENKEPDENIPPASEQTAAAVETPSALDTAPEQEASAWLASQPKANFTLQLMVLSKEQSILGVIKKYPDLQKNFKYVKTILGGREKFVLLYGAFNDVESARAAKKTLPAEFHDSLVRKISAVIHDFGRNSA